MKDRPIDILKKANAKEPLRVKLDLPGLSCWLHTPTRHQISDIQEKLYRIAYADAAELGLVGKPANEAEYERAKEMPLFAGLPRPEDLAEQYAQRVTVTQIIFNLLPSLVRDDAGAELFPTIEEKRMFLEQLRENQEMEKHIFEQWASLFRLREEVSVEAKNE